MASLCDARLLGFKNMMINFDPELLEKLTGDSDKLKTTSNLGYTQTIQVLRR